MTTRKSSFVNMITTMVVVTGAAAFSLGFVYEWTKGPIEKARIEKQMRAIRSVAGDYDNDPLADSYLIYKMRMAESSSQQSMYRREQASADEPPDYEEMLTFYPANLNGELMVMAIKAASESGYSGKIEIMVGFDQDGKIKNIEVLQHRETPGLGSKIKDKEFIDKFVGKSLDDFNPMVKKDGGEIDAISGATISTRAFSEAVQSAYDAYKSQINEN